MFYQECRRDCKLVDWSGRFVLQLCEREREGRREEEREEDEGGQTVEGEIRWREGKIDEFHTIHKCSLPLFRLQTVIANI